MISYIITHYILIYYNNVFAIVYTCSIMQIFNTCISLCKDYNETLNKLLKGNIEVWIGCKILFIEIVVVKSLIGCNLDY